MKVYYNEIDAYCASWLRSLIAEKLLPYGDVDERDIRDVKPSDLDGYTQCHFFAGIGGWAHALNLAGWPEDRPVWTGSCPCQPFSSAGRRAGVADERHLWPHWFHLIEQCKPPIVFGEQVASKDGLGWLDLVQADLEAAGYASAATDMCAAGIGAPHIRQRLWFVGLADSDSTGFKSRERHDPTARHGDTAATEGKHGRVGDADSARASAGVSKPPQWQKGHTEVDDDRMRGLFGPDKGRPTYGCVDDRGRPSPTNGFWRDADWLFCRDGKWRPVEPGTFPLAHGIPARVGRLRAYGNAIVPQVAAEVVKIFTKGEHP